MKLSQILSYSKSLGKLILHKNEQNDSIQAKFHKKL